MLCNARYLKRSFQKKNSILDWSLLWHEADVHHVYYENSYMKIAPSYGRALAACITKRILMHIAHYALFQKHVTIKLYYHRKKILHNLYSSPNIIRMLKSRRMRWVGNVAQIGRRG
jgi:hypothetical protein